MPSSTVRGFSVCRMHGAGGGAPKGNRNALKHGGYTAEAVAERRAFRALLKAAKGTLGAFEPAPGASRTWVQHTRRRGRAGDSCYDLGACLFNPRRDGI